MLTEEEKAILEKEKCAARDKCFRLSKAIGDLTEELDAFKAAHYHWKREYERADYKLAEHEKLTVVTGTGNHKPIKEFTLDQVKSIAGLLGVDLNLGEST